MSKKKSVGSASNDLRALQKEVASLRKQIADLETHRARDIETAAQSGYELGVLEAEEKELARAEAVADAMVAFEQAYAKKAAKVNAVAQSAAASQKRTGSKKHAAKKLKASKAAQKSSRRNAVKAAPVLSSISEVGAVHVPETGEVEVAVTH